QDGTYTYQSNANSLNADDTDVFTYTIEDGDGDLSTATLTINIDNVGGQVDDDEVDVNEAGLPIGSDPTSDSEIDADGQITVTNAIGPFTYTLTGANSDGDGTYGTLVLNASSGEYTYTLDTPFDTTPDDDNGAHVENAAESFTYEVRDGANNLIGTGTINVNITDDIPEIVVDASQTPIGDLETQDADTEGANSDTATSNVSAAFTVSTQEYGADGAGTTTVTYGMALLATEGADTGLNSDGDDIFIYQLADGTIVGSTEVTEPATANDASVIFSISVNTNSGLVTLTQNAEIDHDLPGDTSNYDSQNVDLGTGLVGVTATGDIVDGDGDTDSESETIDIGEAVLFADDGPSIDASVTDGDTVMLVTQDADTIETDTDTATSTANFSGAFAVDSSDYGADGAGTIAWAYSLEVENATSGLASDGNAITLYLISGEVVGSTAGDVGSVNAGNTVFDISVNATSGIVTLNQYSEIDHDLPGASSNYDSQLEALADDLVNLVGTATITDGDGDTDSETVSLDLGGNIKFADDGPSITNPTLGSSVDLDETDAGSPAGFPISDTSVASILSYTGAFGADGAGTTAFTIVVADSDSGLAVADGDYAITLEQTSATLITGTYNDGADKTAFTVQINGDGTVTLTQNVALEHLTDGSTPSDHNDTLDLTDKINGVVTLTDGDGDTASETVAIGGGLTFFDDGPSAVLSGTNDDLEVSDADLATDDTESLADNFTFTGGGDGIASTSYALSVSSAGASSGIVDVATGETVFLFLESGEVVGRHGTDATDAQNNGAVVFTVSVDGSGNVELDQARAIDHDNSPVSGANATLSSDGLVTLTGTVTDNDGDTDSVDLDIGTNLLFGDDTPTGGNNDDVQLDDEAATGASGNAGGTGDVDPDTDNTSGTLTHDFGNDGGSIAFDLSSTVPSGFQIITDGSDGVLIQQDQGSGFVTVITVTLNPATGAYTVTQDLPILHANGNDENDVSFTLDYIVTDGDTDTAPGSITINVDDDTPVVDSGTDSGTVDEDGLTDGIAGGTGDVTGEAVTANGSVTGFFSAGADTPLTYSIDDSSTAPLTSQGLSSGGTPLSYVITATSITATAGGSPVFTFTLNADTGAWTFELEGPLDHDTANNENDETIELGGLIIATDADGDPVTSTSTLTITVDDDTPVAQDDTNSIGEDTASVGGNVLTDGTADGFGADGAGSPAITAITGFGGAGSVGGSTTGEFGSLSLNSDGTYTYNLTNAAVQGLDDGESETDTFTYTIIDADGDTDTATLTITINGDNDAPVAVADTNWVNDVDTGPDPEIMGNVLQDVDHTRDTSGDFADNADTDVDGETLSVSAVTGGTVGGATTGSYGSITINSNGSYTYTLDADNVMVDALGDGETLQDSFTYTVSDGDLTDTATVTITIFGTNAAPVVGTASVATSDEGLANGNADTTGNPTDTTNLATANGNISITDPDDSSFTVTLTIPTESLAVADGTVSGAAITWALSGDGKTLTGTANASTAIQVVIDDTGAFTVTQSQPIFHSDTSSEDVTSFTVDVNVNDGTVTTTQTDAITVSLEDDSPLAVVADDMTATNAAGTYTEDLDSDGVVSDNYGGDGGRVIFTSATITSLEGQALTSGLAELTYSISSDGTVLTAVKSGTTDTVFTITLDPDGANDNDYVVDIIEPLDAITNIDFNDGGYDFVGGNGSWAGFVPLGQDSDGGAPVDDDSQDLLLTPLGGGTVNTNANEGGVSGGNSVGSGEAMRVDYVSDLQGIPVSGGDFYGGDDTQSFDEHYTINGGSAFFTKITSSTTVTIAAFDDDDTGT
ncbi:MAG: VCBS domain-containing protein, partial [Gammaproteobacteria bacterium]|nr:VCBS domain-containing protein [Gammaproteobacteria bacterium]